MDRETPHPISAVLWTRLRNAFGLEGRTTWKDVPWLMLAGCFMASMFSTAIAQALFVLAVAVSLFSFRGWTRPSLQRNLVHLPFAAFALIRILSVLFSEYPANSLPALHREMVFYAMYPVAWKIFGTNTSTRLKVLLRILFGCAFIAAIIGILKVTTGMVPRASSTTAGYYTLGAFLALALVGTASVWRRRDLFPHQWIPLLGMMAMGVALLLTFNRLHYVAAGAGLLIVGWRQERKYLIPVLGVVLALVFLLPQVRDRVLTMGNIRSHASGRDVIFRGAWLLADKHPLLGFGPRTFETIFPIWDQMPDKDVSSWHNDFVQTYIESGSLGLLAYIGLFLQIGILGIPLIRGIPRGPAARFGEPFVYMMIVFLIAGSTLDSLPALWFKAGIAILVVLSRSSLPSSHERCA